MNKQEKTFIGIVLTGILFLAYWGIKSIYTTFYSTDKIERVDVLRGEEITKGDISTEDLMTQRLSVPRAGDIYLIEEPNDSFSFFQIGNVDTTDLVPIIYGAYMLKDSFLSERMVKNMETNFPDYYDTSDIIFIPRSALHEKNKAGIIKQIYRQDHYSGNRIQNTTNAIVYIFGAFLFSLVTTGFICMYYLLIWLLNLGKTRFRERKGIIQLGTILSLVIFVTSLTVFADSIAVDYQEFMFLMIRNLGVTILTYVMYCRLDIFLETKYSFWVRRALLFIGFIVAGTLALIICQIGIIYLIENRWELSLDYLFEDQIYNFSETYIFFNFFPIAIANTIYAFNGYQKKLEQQSKMFEISRLNELKTKAELETLTAKTNPHFLYNSLNTIAALAKTDADKTEKMAIELSKFLKYSTNRKGTNLVPLKEEIEMIETYLKIEKIRFEDQLSFQIDLPKNTENRLVPRFLLQPLVENALKHGYQKGREKISIGIEATWYEEQLILIIKDSGAPFVENFIAGYGLDSVTKKLHLLFPNRHHLELINTPKKMVKISLQVLQ